MQKEEYHLWVFYQPNCNTTQECPYLSIEFLFAVDLLRQQEQKIEELRYNLGQLEHERQLESNRERQLDSNRENFPEPANDKMGMCSWLAILHFVHSGVA